MRAKEIEWRHDKLTISGYEAIFDRGYSSYIKNYKAFRIEKIDNQYAIFIEAVSGMFIRDMFDSLESAKKYCQETLMKKIFDLFFEDENGN